MPELQNNSSHSHGSDHGAPETQYEKVIRIVLILIGFFVSFLLILLVTLHEEQLDELF